MDRLLNILLKVLPLVFAVGFLVPVFNETLIALTWVPDQQHPCPDVKDIQAASDYIQNAFDNCFQELIE